MDTTTSFFAPSTVEKEIEGAMDWVVQQRHITPYEKGVLPMTQAYTCFKQIFNCRREDEEFLASFYGPPPEYPDEAGCVVLTEHELIYSQSNYLLSSIFTCPQRYPLTNVLQVNIEREPWGPLLSILVADGVKKNFSDICFRLPNQKAASDFRAIWKYLQKKHRALGFQLAPVGDVIPGFYSSEESCCRCLPVYWNDRGMLRMERDYRDVEIVLENTHSRTGTVLRKHPWRTEEMKETFKNYVKENKENLLGTVLALPPDIECSGYQSSRAIVVCFALDGYDEEGKAIFDREAFESCMESLSLDILNPYGEFTSASPLFYVDLRNISGANWEEIYTAINRASYNEDGPSDAAIYVHA